METRNPALEEVLDDKNVDREGFEFTILFNTVYPFSKKTFIELHINVEKETKS